jgi:hypothetical protein
MTSGQNLVLEGQEPALGFQDAYRLERSARDLLLHPLGNTRCVHNKSLYAHGVMSESRW